jgi:hypothetical protein
MMMMMEARVSGIVEMRAVALNRGRKAAASMQTTRWATRRMHGTTSNIYFTKMSGNSAWRVANGCGLQRDVTGSKQFWLAGACCAGGKEADHKWRS